MSDFADEFDAALKAAGCTWPVSLCPCTPGNCPVVIGDGMPNDPPKPPYGTPERALWDGEAT